MKLKEFISKEDLREDLADNTGDPNIDFVDEKDINEELLEALESYSAILESSVKGTESGLSMESLQVMNIGINIIKKIKKDDSLFSISQESTTSLLENTLNTLSEVNRLKEKLK